MDDGGRINAIYPNFKNIYERWSALVNGGARINDIVLEIKAPGNKEEATNVMESVTDIIFYMGSDHSDSYDEITYAYNSTFL